MRPARPLKSRSAILEAGLMPAGSACCGSQHVLANPAKGLGPAGSSTPPFVNQLPAQRINFIQTDTPTTPNFLPPPEWINIVAPEFFFVKLPPEPPTLNAASGPTEIDTVVFDAFTAT